MDTKAPNPLDVTVMEKSTKPTAPPAASDEKVMDLPSWRKWTIQFVVCWMTLPATFASSSIMTATAEVAKDFNVPTQSVSTANAGVFIAMAFSSLIWLPISTFIGQRATYLLAAIILTLCSIGSVESQSFAFFVTTWIMAGSTGLYFLVAGQTILADIFEPTARGLAVGLFLGSSVAANSLAPLVGGVIASYMTWRIIYVVQAGMALTGLSLGYLFIPNTDKLHQKTDKPASDRSLKEVLRKLSPLPVFRLFKKPNIIIVDLVCGLLGFNQYSLIASVRRVINPRFNLTTPLISGIFYLAPGAGFLLGSLIGGALSDRTVKQWIRKRNGLRLPHDRLNGCFPAFFFLLPLGTLVYGWSLQLEAGGMALPIISSFVQGFGLMWSFSGLNTYAAEVIPEERTAVISGKYMVQYCFGAGAVGGATALIDAVGVGWASTITGLSAAFGGVLVMVLITSASNAQSRKDAEKTTVDDTDSCASVKDIV